jgi:hypothetical protein
MPPTTSASCFKVLISTSGGGPIWGGHQHGDQLGTALPRDRQREPDQIGGYRPKKIAGPHREGLMQRCRKDFTVRGLASELAERGLKVD